MRLVVVRIMSHDVHWLGTALYARRVRKVSCMVSSCFGVSCGSCRSLGASGDKNAAHASSVGTRMVAGRLLKLLGGVPVGMSASANTAL